LQAAGSRAAMEVFEPCFPRKRFRAALKQVKEIADALGEAPRSRRLDHRAGELDKDQSHP